MENAYTGTGLKVHLTLACEGFTMANNDFDITVKWGTSSRKTFTKEDLAEDDGQYYLCLPTDGMTGDVSVVGTLYVPDLDFEGGIRKEIVFQKLVKLKKVL